MSESNKTPLKRIFRWIIAGLGLLLALLVSLSALSNIGLPTKSNVVERLSDLDKVRLSETFHLKAALGEAAFPGWGQADIPVILYNEQYAFIIGYAQPPGGWTKIPSNELRGGPWEQVPEDTFQDQPYYRQKLPGKGTTPEAFTVKVGDRWVASMSTLQWMQIGLAGQIRQDLPGFLKPIFPYRLAIGALLSSSDQYIASILHESFHAYQGMSAPERLVAAENAGKSAGNRYPWEDEKLQTDWQQELDLLVAAVQASSEQQARDLAQQFLTQRAARRSGTGLSQEFTRYEKQREWVEGVAKYIELEIWRQAASDPDYAKSSEISNDPGFKDYQTYDRFYQQQIDQISRMATDEGDGRFYYSGMAQAILLDRLLPGWKTRLMLGDVYLEDLLQEALGTNANG